MTFAIARAGEAVTREDGKVICFVKNDLTRHSVIRAGDFHRFAEGEQPWLPNAIIDTRCTRTTQTGRLQICIEGEWRP